MSLRDREDMNDYLVADSGCSHVCNLSHAHRTTIILTFPAFSSVPCPYANEKHGNAHHSRVKSQVLSFVHEHRIDTIYAAAA